MERKARQIAGGLVDFNQARFLVLGELRGKYHDEAFLIFDQRGLFGREVMLNLVGAEVPHRSGERIDDDHADKAAKNDVAEKPTGHPPANLHFGRFVASEFELQRIRLALEIAVAWIERQRDWRGAGVNGVNRTVFEDGYDSNDGASSRLPILRFLRFGTRARRPRR